MAGGGKGDGSNGGVGMIVSSTISMPKSLNNRLRGGGGGGGGGKGQGRSRRSQWSQSMFVVGSVIVLTVYVTMEMVVLGGNGGGGERGRGYYWNGSSWVAKTLVERRSRWFWWLWSRWK